MKLSRGPVIGLLLAIPFAAAFIQRPTSQTTTKVVDAANAFLATLSDAERAKGMFPFNSTQRTGWSNLPSGIFQRHGWRFGDLTERQKNAALSLIAVALSREGYQK